MPDPRIPGPLSPDPHLRHRAADRGGERVYTDVISTGTGDYAQPSEHLPCPFCRGTRLRPVEAIDSLGDPQEVRGKAVQCRICRAGGPFAPTVEQAYRLWDAEPAENTKEEEK